MYKLMFTYTYIQDRIGMIYRGITWMFITIMEYNMTKNNSEIHRIFIHLIII